MMNSVVPQSPRRPGSEVDADPPRRARPLAGGAHPAQPLYQHRVGRERLGGVDQRIEHLVVARRTHVEEFLDRLLLGPGVLPPLPFEAQDLAVPLSQARQAGSTGRIARADAAAGRGCRACLLLHGGPPWLVSEPLYEEN